MKFYNYPMQDVLDNKCPNLLEHLYLFHKFPPIYELAKKKSIPFEDWTLRQLAEVRALFVKGSVEHLFKAVFMLTGVHANEIKLKEFIQFCSGIVKQLKTASEFETNALQVGNTKGQSSGFEKYKEYNYCYLIGKFFNFEPIKVLDWRFSDVMITINYILNVQTVKK